MFLIRRRLPPDRPYHRRGAGSITISAKKAFVRRTYPAVNSGPSATTYIAPGPCLLFTRRILFSHSYDGKIRAFSKSSWHDLDDTVWSTDPQTIQMISINGVIFRHVSPGVGFSPSARYVAPPGAGEFSNALLTWEGRWKIKTYGGIWHYLGCTADSAIPCYFVDRSDIAGDRISVERDTQGRITRAVQSTGHGMPVSDDGFWSLIPGWRHAQSEALPDSHDHIWIFTYDGPTIQRIEDNQGGEASYAYNAMGYLSDVKSDGRELHVEYDEQNRMNRVVEDGSVLGIHYDEEGRADEIDFAGTAAFRIHYGGEKVEVSYGGRVYEVKTRGNYFQVNVESQ